MPSGGPSRTAIVSPPMRAMWVFVALVFASGCAQKDWIDRTLVTVDVTGTWYGMAGGPANAHPGEFLLELNGDAMSGTVLIAGTRLITLRRGDPSSSR